MQNIHIYYHYEVKPADREFIRNSIKKMFKVTSLRGLYKDFFEWMGTPELFKPAQHSAFEYADVFPLIYLKIRFEGLPRREKVKHLLVDEMQDYTPVQYAVLDYLFPCKKTILGNIYQSVNPFGSSSAEDIQRVFIGADCVRLHTSYRSSFEITRFAQRINRNADLVAIERHGEEPEVLHFKTHAAEVAEILRRVREFHQSGFHSLGMWDKFLRLLNNFKDWDEKDILFSFDHLFHRQHGQPRVGCEKVFSFCKRSLVLQQYKGKTVFWQECA